MRGYIERQLVSNTNSTTGLLLPSANEVCEGYVFTPVCHSVHRGVCLGRGLGGLPEGGVQAQALGVSRPRPRGCPGQDPGGAGPGLGQGGPGPGPRGCVSQHALWQTPPPADDYCCGWYASYWNAFLFLRLFLVHSVDACCFTDEPDTYAMLEITKHH